MYITRRLSEYQRNPAELTRPPPEGPNSGILVIQDQDKHRRATCCFSSWLVLETCLSGLPLPQNLKLAVTFNIGGDDATRDPVVFIPVLDKPLSSNCYYAIKRRGKHSGKAAGNAKEDDIETACFCIKQVAEAEHKQLDPFDIYQQLEIHQKNPSSRRRYYYATSVAPDGIPPWFLRNREWNVECVRSQDFELTDDAKGVNKELRAELPNLGMSTVVGKWYVPFIFVKERDAKDQIKNSMYYYSMTLEQRWEEVFSCDDDKSEKRDVVFDVQGETEVVKLEGQEEIERGVEANGFVWFGVGDEKIGLGSVVVERMKWEEERFGWTSKGDQEKEMAGKRLKKSKDGSFWTSYQCYVLIESFVLKRMDGSLVLTYEFTHVDKVKTKWD
ncbi:PREDICTED: uncharacterized protein LOC104755634 [Camelina sativa]|uniref:Uncharacterized protein LOC104755634 n=1 Tax=Camelina sativa TaxID=90675 RepID=A0ABM0WUH8_CAMSA|nr:PREDICTED: uncharacterized protein LOC104755634 [Camelina sativa]